jgi:hypothetical protein
MAKKLSGEWRRFVKGCVANYLDNQAAKPHTARDMARWATIALRRTFAPAASEKPTVGAAVVVTLINELRNDGYLIQRDPGGKGFVCTCGRRNGTPAVGLIIDALAGEKKRVAKTIENTIVRPTITVQQTVVSGLDANQALRMVADLRKQDGLLYEAVGAVKQLAQQQYRLVPVESAPTDAERAG